MTYGTVNADLITTSDGVSSAGLYGLKNRLINGDMKIAQRATSATITAGSTIAAGYSTVDRFYVYCTGANVTAAQVVGSGATKNRLQITGAASVTAIGIGQRIEQANSYDLAGSTATLSCDLANSLLTTVTWTAYYANTADTFGTLASPTRTQIATGNFTVTSTVTNYNAQISVPSAATTGIEIVFTVGAQTSGTWTIGNIQLEKGSTATSYDYLDYGRSLIQCQRYYEKSFDIGTAPAQGTTTTGQATLIAGKVSTGTQYSAYIGYKAQKRDIPATVTFYNPTNGNAQARDYTAGGDCSSTALYVSGTSGFTLQAAGNAATTVGNLIAVQWSSTAEL